MDHMKKILSLIIIAALLIVSCTVAFGETAQTETEAAATTEASAETGDTAADTADNAEVTPVETPLPEEDETALEEEMKELLQSVEETEAVPANGDVVTNDENLNILLIGTDERSDEFSDNARGDTCMLFSVNLQTGEVKLVSFERGLGVPILEGEYEGQWDWLTHTFRYGGADLMMREIRENFKVDVDKYVRVNLHTFVKLVDAVGGVDIELNSYEAHYINGSFGRGTARDIGVQNDVQTVSAGVNHMNGATALVYARCRHIDSDWHRIERQRNVIIAAMKQLATLDADAMKDVLLAMIPVVKTNINLMDAAQLISVVPNLIGGDVQQLTIPLEGTYGSKIGMGGRSMYSVDFEKNAKILDEFITGKVTAEEAVAEAQN